MSFWELCFFSFFAVGVGRTCGPREYTSAAGMCCPKCNIGSVVNHDCSEDFSTICKNCTPGTFMDEPNGLYECFTCKTCAESQGLYVRTNCTKRKDTICDVLEGYYCAEYSNSQCRRAQKHRVCKSGQKPIPGTKTSDTTCVNCTHGFYSPSGLSCTKWTDCTARNEIQTEIGSSVKDVTCTLKRRERYGLILPVALTACLSIILYLRPLCTRWKTVKDLSDPPADISSGPSNMGV